MLGMSRKLFHVATGPLKLINFIITKCWELPEVLIPIGFLFYWFYGGIAAVCLLCFAAAGALYHIEDAFLYFPNAPKHARLFVSPPSMFNLPYQNVYTTSEDGTKLHMFFISQPKERSKEAITILFLHGNAGNIGHRLGMVVGLYHNIKCNILLLEYRGYGLSEGSPSEEGLYKDAQAGFNYLAARTDINKDAIVVYGRSLGGAVAIDLAARAEYGLKIWGLIVENTFTSIPDMAVNLLQSKLFTYLPLFMYKNKYLSIHKVRSVFAPTLFISGMADKLVPPVMMKNLFRNCQSSLKRFLPFPGGTHNETWRHKLYFQGIRAWLKDLDENSQSRPVSMSSLEVDMV